MGVPRTGPGASGFEEDYQVIRLKVSWGALSVIAFVTVLTLQLFGRTLGVSLRDVIGATMALSVAGFVLGLIGLWFGKSRGAARAGAFLNGVVLLCIFVILPATYMILRWLG